MGQLQHHARTLSPRWLCVAVLAGLLAAAGADAATVEFRVDVPARTEVEVCQYLQVELGRPGDTLAGFRVKLDGDSHHFHLFDATGVPPRTREITLGGVSSCVEGDVVAVVSADSPRVHVRFPRGVRLPWQGRQALVANYHVENRSDRPRRMRARVRLALRPPRAGDRLARRWGFQLTGMRVPPHATGLFEATRILDEPLEFFTITGHMHSRGTMLLASHDGAPWYRMANWRHPRIQRYFPPLHLPAGTAIHLACELDNGVRRPVRTCEGVPCDLVEGVGVEDAMCTVAGYVLTPFSAAAGTSAAPARRDTRTASRAGSSGAAASRPSRG